MGKYAGVGGAKFNEGGVFFEPGNYLVRVDAVKEGQTRKKQGFFVVETTILESDNPERKRGSGCSWMSLEEWDNHLGNVNHFVSVAQQCEPEEVDEEGVEMVISDENPCAGVVLKVKATNVPTRAGGTFTKVKFMWPEAEDFERIGYSADGTPKKKSAKSA